MNQISLGVLKILPGRILGTIFLIISYALLTNFYNLEDIGKFAVFTSTLSLISPFADLGLSNAIPLNINNNKDTRLKKFIIIFLIFFLLVFFLISILLLDLNTIFFLNNLEFITLFFFNLFLYKINEFLISTQLQKKNYFRISLSLFFKSFGLCILLYIFKELSVKGIIYSSVLSLIIANTVLYEKNIFKIFRSILKVKYKIVLIENKDFIKFQSLNNAINTGSRNLLTLFVAYYFSEQETALFFLSISVLFIISDNISKLNYFIIYSNINFYAKKLKSFIPRLFNYLNVIYVNLMIICCFIFYIGVELFLDKDYLQLGLNVFLFSPWMIGILFFSSVEPIIFLKKKQKNIFLINIYFLFSRLVLSNLAGYYENMILLAVSISISSLIIIFYFFSVFFKEINIKTTFLRDKIFKIFSVYSLAILSIFFYIKIDKYITFTVIFIITIFVIHNSIKNFLKFKI